MRKLTTIISAFSSCIVLALGGTPESIQDLSSHRAQERAQAAYQLSSSAARLDYATYQKLIDLLNDSERVLIEKEQGQRKNTTPGLEARKTLLKAGPAAVEALGVGLIEQRPSIRWRLCDILGHTPSDDAIEALLNVLRVDAEKLVRNTASEALAQIGKPALPFLIESLHTGQAHVRTQVIWILSEMKDPETLTLLLSMAMDESSPLAGSAIEAVYKFGEASIAPCLNILQNDNRTVARERAAFMLGRIDSPASTRGLAYVFLTDQNDRLRMICLQSLHKHNEPKLCDLILNAITDPNPQIVAMAKPMLKKYGVDAANSMLSLMQNRDARLAEIAFEGLMSLGSGATPVYIMLAKNETLPVAIRRRAAQLAREHSFKGASPEDRLKCLFVLQDWAGLAVFGNQFQELYMQGAYASDENERLGSTIMLGELSNYQTLNVLIDKLSDPSMEIQEAAYYGLSKMGRSIQKELVNQLNGRMDSSSTKIASLLKGFKFIPKNDVERILIRAANQRWKDMDTLGERALSYLSEQLKSPDKSSTLWAAHTLAQWHQHTPLTDFDLEKIDPMLFDLLDVKESYKREKAFDLLMRQANYESISYLFVPLLIPEPEHTEIAAQKISQLGVIGMDMLALALLSDLKEAYDPALNALEMIGEPAIPMLASGLNNPKFNKQILAILDRINYKPKTPNEEVAFLLATEEYESLVRMGNLGINALITICNGPDHPKKAAIYDALKHGRLPEINALLVRALAVGTSIEKQVARASLAAIGESAIPQIRAQITSGNFVQALQAAKLLETMGFTPENRNEFLWNGVVRQSPEVLINHEAEVLQLLSQNMLSDYENLRQISTGTMALMREQKGLAIKNNTYELAENIQENLKHENAEIRAESARLVGQYGKTAYHLIPELLTVAKDNTPLIINGKISESKWGVLSPAWFAAQALVNMGSPAVEPFLETYSQASTLEKETLALVLSTMSDPRLVAQQRNLIYDPRPAIQQAAIVNLAKAQDLEIVPQLLELADENKILLFNTILDSISQMGAPVAPFVISHYDAAASSAERASMAALLTHCTTPEAYKRIEAFLEEANPNQAKTLYKMLRTPDDQKSITLLISGLKNQSWSVREAIADSLVAKGPKGLPILIPALDVPDETLRGYLRQVLRLVTQKDFGNNNKAWQVWWKEQNALEQT